MRITSKKLKPLTRYRRIFELFGRYRKKLVNLSQTQKERLLVQFHQLQNEIEPKWRIVKEAKQPA